MKLAIEISNEIPVILKDNFLRTFKEQNVDLSGTGTKLTYLLSFENLVVRARDSN